MSKNKSPIPKVKPRKQAVLRRLEDSRHEKKEAQIDAMSENNHLGRRAVLVAAGTVAVLGLAAGISSKVESHSSIPRVDTGQEGLELPDGVTTITADSGDGYEMLVRKEAERSRLSESEIKALQIQDLTYDAKDLNGGVMVHPNVEYYVPDIPDRPQE